MDGKVSLLMVGYRRLNWIELAQRRMQWLVFMDIAMDLGDLWKQIFRWAAKVGDYPHALSIWCYLLNQSACRSKYLKFWDYLCLFFRCQILDYCRGISLLRCALDFVFHVVMLLFWRFFFCRNRIFCVLSVSISTYLKFRNDHFLLCSSSCVIHQP
jgi:hypothetical protein